MRDPYRPSKIQLFAALLFTSSWPFLAAAQETTTLEQVREIYAMHTAENFDDGGAVSHYVWRHFPSFFPHATVAHIAPIRPLELALDEAVADFAIETEAGAATLADYVNSSPLVDALIVLHRGRIVYEAYPRMQPYERHLGWSITKVVVGTALAALEYQGRVDMDAAVQDYVPELLNSQWTGIRLRDVANMASGIACRDGDGYQNTEACIYRFEESLGLTAPVNPPQTTLANIVAMRRDKEPGTAYEYVSANTFVSGLVIEKVTGLPLWLALQQLIWQPIGAEADAMLMVSPDGTAASHGGLSARLRDIARFGQIFTLAGELDVINSSHLADLRSANGIEFDSQRLDAMAERFGEDIPRHAAWQWDMIWPDGAMFKGGYSGQGLYVDPGRDLIAAWYGTDSSEGERNTLLPMLRSLARSQLFDSQ